VISALKQVANAATNAVHSATGNVTGHAHSNSGESTGLLEIFLSLSESKRRARRQSLLDPFADKCHDCA